MVIKLFHCTPSDGLLSNACTSTGKLLSPSSHHRQEVMMARYVCVFCTLL